MISEYQQVLENILARERFEMIFILLLATVPLILLWVIPLRHYKKMSPRKRAKKQTEIRKSLLGQIALTAIIAALVGIGCWGSIDTCRSIQLDIDEKSYISYSGEMDFEPEGRSRRRLYDRRQGVRLEDGSTVCLYRHNLWDALSARVGTYRGQVVYGKHSYYIVDLKLSE